VNLMPAEIDSITLDDRERRIFRIRIPGLTDNATEMPEAELNNPLGDKSETTEIRIKVNDRVWVAFVNGDTRYPVIIGFRPRNQENGVDWRRFEHANFEFNADNTVHLIAGTQVTVTTPLALIDAADTHVTGTLTVDGLFTYKAGMHGSGGAGATAVIDGGISATGDIKAGNISLEGHGHTEQGDGKRVSNPIP